MGPKRCLFHNISLLGLSRAHHPWNIYQPEGTQGNLEFLKEFVSAFHVFFAQCSGAWSFCQQLNTQCPVWLLGTVPNSQGTFQRNLRRCLQSWRTRQREGVCLKLVMALVFPVLKWRLVLCEFLLPTYIRELVALPTWLRLWWNPVWTMTPCVTTGWLS